jgi:H+/gluconate symporter-like permease
VNAEHRCGGGTPGFWFVKEYFALSMNDMFKSYTASTIIAAFVGLATLMAFRLLIGA